MPEKSIYAQLSRRKFEIQVEQMSEEQAKELLLSAWDHIEALTEMNKSLMEEKLIGGCDAFQMPDCLG